jgi:hypothetical protein
MNIFYKLFCKKRLVKNGLYSIEYGDKAGGFLVYIREENILTGLAFLVLPNPLEIIYLSSEDVNSHFKNGGLVLVDKLPKSVYDVCKANFVWVKNKEGIK